jgi:hypothetical protein
MCIKNFLQLGATHSDSRCSLYPLNLRGRYHLLGIYFQSQYLNGSIVREISKRSYYEVDHEISNKANDKHVPEV